MARSSSRSARSAIARPSSPRASRPPRARRTPSGEFGRGELAELVVGCAVKHHDRRPAHPRDALRADSRECRLDFPGCDDDRVVGDRGRCPAKCLRPGIDHEQRVMPRRAREPERVGSSHGAEAADGARSCAGQALEDAREPGGGALPRSLRASRWTNSERESLAWARDRDATSRSDPRDSWLSMTENVARRIPRVAGAPSSLRPAQPGVWLRTRPENEAWAARSSALSPRSRDGGARYFVWHHPRRFRGSKSAVRVLALAGHRPGIRPLRKASTNSL